MALWPDSFDGLSCASLPQLIPERNMSAERRTKTTSTELANALPPDEVLFGRSEAMKEIRKRAAKIAGTSIPVLLCGPKGTGKELLARWIHSHSADCNSHFVKDNCAALPGTF